MSMFTRKLERRVYVFLGVFGFSLLLGLSFGTYVLWPSHLEAGYQPVQPIAFSHRLHAGDMKMPCLYCHTQATYAAQASVPMISTCMKCHQEVQVKDASGQLTLNMQILLDHWNRREPIVWNKVHDLADFVYFDHSRHLSAGLSCQECHGPVEQMDHMRRQYGMKMSWCLDCHRQPLTDQDPPGTHERAAQQHRTTRAPTDCSACHR